MSVEVRQSVLYSTMPGYLGMCITIGGLKYIGHRIDNDTIVVAEFPCCSSHAPLL